MAKAPDIYFFNPTCEYAAADGKHSWQPNLLLQKMEEDLGVLPLFFAQPDDIILIKKMPPVGYISHLAKVGILAPHFFSLLELKKNKSFQEMPKNRLLPWGWSPAAHWLLEPLKKSCSEKFLKSPVAEWKPQHREIYSRKFALQILQSVLPILPEKQVLQTQQLPVICKTQAEVENQIAIWGRILIKAPWSSSGRGQQRITKKPVTPKVWEKILGIIKDQRFVMVEPLLDKVLDMALLFEIKNANVKFSGISRFFTDAKGQYQGNYLNGWPEALNVQACQFAENMAEMLIHPLQMAIENSKVTTVYEGSFGIDMLLFRDENKLLRIHPCLEINMRQNMGLLSLHLEKLLSPGKKGFFKIFYQPGKSFLTFQKEIEINYPLKINNQLIESGFYSLTPADEISEFGAYLLVS
jgi:hypothetical protein